MSDRIPYEHVARYGNGIAFLDCDLDSYSCSYDPVAVDQAQSPSPAPRPRWRNLPDATAIHIGPRDFAYFAIALAKAAMRFNTLGFADLVGSGRPMPRVRDPGREQTHALVVARFERMSLFLPIKVQCLFRSFLLLHFLSLYGLGADWVFGVTLFPFRAHCWIASGDLLLGEVAHRAERYVPILIIAERHK